MEQDKVDHPEDEFLTVDTTAVSSTSPYQPTTEPVPHRRSIAAGMIMDVHFVKSLPGVLKIGEILCSIVVAICVGTVKECGSHCSVVTFMEFVSITCIIATSIIYIIFMLNLQHQIEFVDWPLTDLVNAVIAFLFYLIGSSILAAKLNQDSEKAAVAFGFISVILYLINLSIAYKAFMLERRKHNSPISHIQADNTDTQPFA